MRKINIVKHVASVLVVLSFLLSGCAETMMTKQDGNNMPGPASENRMMMDDPEKPAVMEEMMDSGPGMKEKTMDKSEVDRME